MTGPTDDDADRQADREPTESETEPSDAKDEDLDAKEVDERFAELIADFDAAPVWPREEDDDSAESVDAEESAEPVAPAATTEDPEPTLLELWDTELPDDPEDAENEYVPPPPPPLPRPSAPAVLGVVLILGGLALVVSPTLLDVGAQLGMLTGIAAFLGGAAMLVWRLRPDPEDDDDDPGNGAIV